MKRLFVTAVAISLLSSLAVAAHADGRDRHDREDRSARHHYRDHHHRYRPDHRVRHEVHYHRHHVVRHVTYQRPHGYYYRAWRRGDRLPVAYRASRYYVTDYHTYRLRTPPRGYRWIRVDNDVMLTALATGVVIQVVDGLFR